ncbi:LysR family transcriptional regulator substrate-binding protein [Geodermatophilus sp. SYSU D00684]
MIHQAPQPDEPGCGKPACVTSNAGRRCRSREARRRRTGSAPTRPRRPWPGPSAPATPSPRSPACSAARSASPAPRRRPRPRRTGRRRGQVDFAVTPLTHLAGPALRFEPLAGTPVAIVCPAGQRLAGALDVDPGEVADEPVIDLPRGWWVRDLFDRLMADRDIPRQVRLEADEWFGVLTMVQRGLGTTSGPQACLDEAVFGDVAVATSAGAPLWELGIVSRDEVLRGAAGRAVLAAHRSQCRGPVGGHDRGPAEV